MFGNWQKKKNPNVQSLDCSNREDGKMRPSQEKHHSEVFQKPGVESLSRPKAINEQMPITDQVMRVRLRAPATWKSLPRLMQFQETGWTKPEWEQEAARGVEAVETELLEEAGCKRMTERMTRRCGSTLTRLHLMGGRCRRGRIEQERVGCSAGTGFDSCMNMVKRGKQWEGTDANTGLLIQRGTQVSFAL